MAEFDPKAYWEQRLRKESGLSGVGYLALGGPFNTWMYRVRRRVFRRLVRFLDLDLGRAEILDIGSGTGFYIDRWRALRASVICGADLTPVAVERLQGRYPDLEFRQLDVSAEIPEDWRGRFDVVSIFDVLFHIVDDARYAQALRNLAALLKPGGWLVLSENSLRGRTERAPHVVSRSEAEITSLLTASGFRIVKQGPMFVLMNYPVDTRGRFLKSLWSTLTLPLRANRLLGVVTGSILGAILYPIELVLTAVVKPGPSTKFAVCRKDDGVSGPRPFPSSGVLFRPTRDRDAGRTTRRSPTVRPFQHPVEMSPET